LNVVITHTYHEWTKYLGKPHTAVLSNCPHQEVNGNKGSVHNYNLSQKLHPYLLQGGEPQTTMSPDHGWLHSCCLFRTSIHLPSHFYTL